MIITRSPLRISLGGGGTDMPSYYREHGGFVISAAIDKYVYITIHEGFTEDVLLKYSQLERVRKVEEIRHPLIREALLLTGVNPTSLEIASMSDIPAGTGLGSSGSFTVALLHALHTLQKRIVSTQELAEFACSIEIEKLGEPVGKQDQYIAAFGGITCFHFHPDGKVVVEPLHLQPETLANLEDNLMVFFTGYTRSAADILREQDVQSRARNASMLSNLHKIKEFGLASRTALAGGDLRQFAAIMHEHWQYKKRRSAEMTNGPIDNWYELARRNGALGGKLIGAGGGGFLMFYSEDKTHLRRTMHEAGLREVRMRFDFLGATVVVH
jgi:D-glycero-alpha-D-manno-heptose-7-phosphate kinase